LKSKQQKAKAIGKTIMGKTIELKAKTKRRRKLQNHLGQDTVIEKRE